MRLNTSHIRLIRDHPEMSIMQLTSIIGCSHTTVREWRHNFGICNPRDIFRNKVEKFLCEHYRIDMNAQEIAECLGISRNMVYKFAKKFNLNNDISRNKTGKRA